MIKGKNLEKFKQYNIFTGEYDCFNKFINRLIIDNELTFFDFYFINLKEN